MPKRGYPPLGLDKVLRSEDSETLVRVCKSSPNERKGKSFKYSWEYRKELNPQSMVLKVWLQFMDIPRSVHPRRGM